MKPFISLLVVEIFLFSAYGNSTVFTNAYDLTLEMFRLEGKTSFPLDISGTVIQTDYTSHGPKIIVKDASGTVGISEGPESPIAKVKCNPGDIVRVTGLIESNGPLNVMIYATQITVVGHGPPPPEFIDITAEQLLSGRFNGSTVRLKGSVIEARRDETDPCYLFMMVDDNSDTAFIAAKDNGKINIDEMIGAQVSIIGRPTFAERGKRRFDYQELFVKQSEKIKILKTPDASIDNAPSIQKLKGLPPNKFHTHGFHKATGKVIAVLKNDSFLMKTHESGICRVKTAYNRLPNFGDSIEAVGIPASDLYNINLLHAVWKRIPDINIELPSISDATTRELPYPGTTIKNMMNVHGAPVRLTGIVRQITVEPNNKRTILIENNNRLAPIEASLIDVEKIFVGSEIEVSGICVLDIDLWLPNTLFAKVKNFIIVPRNSDDICILSDPPWWTPQKLILVITSLITILGGFLGWNFSLRKAAARKGRELMHEQIDRVEAELKTEERTRLAVELHDSLAQNLTGVSLEIDTAAKVADNDGAAMKVHLGIAARSLKSCRDELRNCLWDLRNRALEAKTMDEAIRQTLAPHIAGIEVAIRFAVARERISDNSAHAILRIIRELALNGIRHGAANKIWIAGSIEDDRLLFSVRDNGTGFDPGSVPGFNEGHYGLLGIQERVDEFEGEFTLESVPGKGTKATVSLKVPCEV